MTKPALFLVKPTDPQALYLPGSQVTGALHLHTTAPITARAVRLRFYGKVKTTVRVSRSGTNGRSQTTTYHATLNIFDMVMNFWGSPDTGVSVPGSTLPPGEYVFPYAFNLPLGIPSSFEEGGSSGHIRYKLKGIIDIPFGTDYETITLLVVNAPLSLNRIQTHLLMTGMEYEKTVCCMMFANGTIHVKAAVPRAVFTYGEVIPINIVFENSSRRQITDIWVEVIRTTKFIASGHSTTSISKVLRMRIDGMVEKENMQAKLYGAMPLPVDKLSTPTIDNAQNLIVEYELGVSASVSNALGIKMRMPLLIGIPSMQLPPIVFQHQAMPSSVPQPAVNTPAITAPAPVVVKQ
ncbi:hypothetical protein RI367_003812 [Sorochytrium milnesiophthora]